MAEKSSNPLKSWYLRSLSKSLEIEEVSIINDVDTSATITNEDEGGLTKELTPLPQCTLGVDVETDIAVEFDGADHVFHFGSMDWEPNIEATRWLLEEVWALVLKNILKLDSY